MCTPVLGRGNTFLKQLRNSECNLNKRKQIFNICSHFGTSLSGLLLWPLQEISSMAGSAAMVEASGEGEAEAMEQGDSEAVATGQEPMHTTGELGEEGTVRVVAIEEGSAGEAGTMLQVHVAMEAQPGQGDQTEVCLRKDT